MRGVDTLEQLAAVKRIPIEAAKDTVVLNADDPLCLRMAGYSQADNICYVTVDSKNLIVRQHIRAGGRAVALEDGINGQMISIYEKGRHMPLLWTHLIPATVEGQALHNVQNAMFATAMAFSMGVSLDNIRQGLRTFDTSFFQTPGRMNIFDKLGFKVILDYGHNPAAVQAMCRLVDGLVKTSALGPEGRRVCVLSAPGDRRDQDIQEIAKIASSSFDLFICRQDDRLRRREYGEVPRLLKQGLLDAGVAEQQIVLQCDENDAVQYALQQCKQGDLLLIFADNTTRSWKQIIYFHDALLAEGSTNHEDVEEPDVYDVQSSPDLEELQLQQDSRGVFIAPELSD